MDTNTDITIGTFIQYLTYYLQLSIYVNKGTEDNVLLERCIKLYNKCKKIEVTEEEIDSADEVFIRKMLKRFNLVLKVDINGNPVNISDKSNQTKILELNCHESLLGNSMKEMIEYAK